LVAFATTFYFNHGFGIMNPRESIGRWISVIYRHMQMYINKELEQYHIGSGQFQILIVLSRNDGINQESISKILNLDKATVGRAVNKVVKEGYVNRLRDQKDHRAYVLHLTPKGKEIVPNIQDSLRKITQVLLSDFTPDEKEIALNLLKKMHQNITAIEPLYRK